MPASTWIFQKKHQLKKLGSDRASWYVGYYDLDGKQRCRSFGPGFLGQKNAQRFAVKITDELDSGRYQAPAAKITWDKFRAEYQRKILSQLSPRSRDEALVAINHFERLVRPGRVATITTSKIDDYVAQRRLARGKKEESTLSPATINKELRHLKAALRVAVEWNHLQHLPKFRMVKVPKRLPTYVTPEDFGDLYRACAEARLPADLPCAPADWWRALFVMAYMTGWRISDLLGLRREDLDLDAGTAITRAEVSKSKRDDIVKLHPIVIEHLRALFQSERRLVKGRLRLPSALSPLVFPWNHNRRTLQGEFAKIQEAAGIHLACPGEHKHTRFCHVYGFHDFRRAFATMNARNVTGDVLQALMRHKSYQTTQIYINIANQVIDAVGSLFVPVISKSGAS